MTDKKKKSKIADILLEFYEEYQCNMSNRPMIPSLYASKIIDSMREEPVSEELEKVVEEIVEPTILNAYGTKELARRLRNTICGTSVSEELEEAAEKYAYELFPSVGVANTETELAFKAGAKWQFNQLEKNRLAACDRASKEEIEREQDFCDKIIIGEHRQPTFSDAIEYGIKWQKQQMMAKAIDSRVYIDAGGYPYIPQMELYDYDKDVPLAKEGDKYKVILIKEQCGCNRKETLQTVPKETQGYEY